MSQASQAFERFLQGEDRLARLLCELPAYVPSAAAEFEAAFARAARAAQAQQDAMRTVTAAGQAAASGTARLESTRLDAIPSAFEPPASLQASFLKMAASIESAQAPRREAILRGIAKGDSPQAMLGAPIAPSSEKWLRAQAPATAPIQPAPPASPSPPARKHPFLGFRWFDLRLAALACVLAVIGTQLALMHDPQPAQIAVQEIFENALTKRDSSNEADLARGDTRGPLADAQLALNEANTAMLQRRQDRARLAAQEREAASSPLKKSEARASAPQARLAKVIDGEQPESALPPPPATPADNVALAEAKEVPARLAAHKVAKPSALDSGMAGEAHADAPSAQPAPPAEKPASATPAMPRPTTVAAAPSMAAGPASTNDQKATDTSISGTLADDPAHVASLLPARPAGAVWTVYSSQPSQPELERWLEALRQQIPESSRPARFELIKDDARRGPMHLRIVPPALPETR